MPPQQRDLQNDSSSLQEASPLQQRHSTVGADRLLRFDPAPNVVERRKSFMQEFTAAKGPPQIVILVMLLALGFGSTIGVVRRVVFFALGRV